MSIRVRRFEPDDAPAIDRLNARLAACGITDRVYPEAATTFAEARGDALSQELYVAVDNDEVRGGVWLHEHQFIHRAQVIRAGWLKYPVSESLINREYGGVPGALLVTLTRRQPEIMALGMGHRTTPIAQLLCSLGWGIIDVPFYAAPVRLARLLGHLPELRSVRWLERWAKIAARTGLATAAAAPINALRRVRTGLLLKDVVVSPVSAFGPWADAIWTDARDRYGFIARRDAAMLNQFYSQDFPRLTRLRVMQRNADIGWICVTLANPASQAARREFGELRVGLLADALGIPANAPVILAAGMRHLVSQGADVIVTNQMHPSWRRPLRYLGFVQRPTNFLFAYSRRIAGRLADEIEAGDLFLNRGDCDGPPRWA